jgi:hypothetical protein
MAVSTTTTFTLTRDGIIQYSLRKLGVIEAGVTPDATMVANAATALNMMIKSWLAKGVKLWTVTELTLPIVSGQTSYGIGNSGPDLVTNKPMRIMQGWLRNVSVTPQNDIPLQLLAKHDYNALGSKQSTGTPNSVFLDVQRDSATLSCYPTPDVTAATLYQVHMVVQRPILDIAAAADNADFPTEWLSAIGWNLAAELATDFGVDAERLQYIELKAAKALTEMEEFDIEQTSVFFAPDLRYNR